MNRFEDRAQAAEFFDAAALATEIRAVAAEACRLKRHQSSAAYAVSPAWAQLDVRVNHLRTQLEAFRSDHQLPLDQLARWLGNLQRWLQERRMS